MGNCGSQVLFLVVNYDKESAITSRKICFTFRLKLRNIRYLTPKLCQAQASPLLSLLHPGVDLKAHETHETPHCSETSQPHLFQLLPSSVFIVLSIQLVLSSITISSFTHLSFLYL